jgi:hypothetical protein
MERMRGERMQGRKKVAGREWERGKEDGGG